MAKSIVAKVLPRLDNGAVQKLQKQLNTPFVRIAKTFGNSLNKIAKTFSQKLMSGAKAVPGMLGRGMAGAGKATAQGIARSFGGDILGFITHLMSQAKEQFATAAQAMDEVLNKADDIQTLASSLGMDAFDTMNLLQTGELAGLEQDSIAKFLTTFRDLRAQEKLNPGSTGLTKEAMEGSVMDAFVGNIRALQHQIKEGQALQEQAKSAGDPEERQRLDLEGQKIIEKAFAEAERVYGARPSAKMLEFLLGEIDKDRKDTAIYKVYGAKGEKGKETFNKENKRLAELEDKRVRDKQYTEFVANQNRGSYINNSSLVQVKEVETKQMEAVTNTLEAQRLKTMASAVTKITSIENAMVSLTEAATNFLDSAMTTLGPILTQIGVFLKDPLGNIKTFLVDQFNELKQEVKNSFKIFK
ncbi:MAG: hypothetical protein LBC07_00110 [Elusimicrobiota bacterium]|jgi:hypothetical protein|nr:hypothetical protein [Elusimicrobiota bacterium]